MNWDSITLGDYQKFLEYKKTQIDSDLKRENFADYSFLEGSEVMNKSVAEIEQIVKKWDFIFYTFDNIEPSPILNVDNKVYYIEKNFASLSGFQHQNYESLLTEDPKDKIFNIHKILGIVVQRKNEYSHEKALELGELILNSKMSDLIPQINFFLSNETDYLNSLNSYLTTIIQKQKSEMMTSYSKHGGGILSFSTWRTKILLILTKLVIKRLEILYST